MEGEEEFPPEGAIAKHSFESIGVEGHRTIVCKGFSLKNAIDSVTNYHSQLSRVRLLCLVGLGTTEYCCATSSSYDLRIFAAA